MKKVLLTLFILSSSLVAFSQGVWSSRDTLPDSVMFQGITGFSIGNYGYTGLGQYGSSNTYFTSIWQFNPATNSWIIKTHFPGRARVAPASFVIGNNAYLVTGSVRSAGACVTECWEYNSTNNVWRQRANFPGSSRTYAVGFAIGGKGYVGTGANEYTDFRKDFYAYDTATNTWTRIADFGGVAISCATGFAVNGNGYVCFGKDSTLKVHNDIWEYDTGTNSWTQKANNPAEGLQLPIGFVICNNIYVGSGDSTAGDNIDHRFWKFNTTLDTWTQETSLPGRAGVESVAFAVGDTGYSGFGIDSVGNDINTFYRFYAGDSCNIDAGYNIINNVPTVNIFPNPTTGIFTISFSHPELVLGSQTIIEIYNVLGEKVTIGILKQVQLDYKIDLSSQPSGVYLYRVLSEGIPLGNAEGGLLGEGKLVIQK